MIPMDTVKTRLVTQAGSKVYSYNGILDCFTRMIREEGIGSFYNSLTPRLVSVVPMIGVQYFVYEASNEPKLVHFVPVVTCYRRCTACMSLECMLRAVILERLIAPTLLRPLRALSVPGSS